MKTFHTTRRVNHSARNMFDLVAKVEEYPLFLPLCETTAIRHREHRGHREAVVADMTVAYKFFHETFTTRATFDPHAPAILVEYLDGPFKHLENRWRFHAVDAQSCDVDFYIAYEFASRRMQFLMGALFDKAFRKFVDAFEERADQVYGRHGPAASARPSAPPLG